MEHLKMHSLNKIDENIAKIATLFPNCVTEAKNDYGEIIHKIDFDMLKQELSNTLVEGREERYQFTWPDKKQAILTANAPINKTLRPCREESVNFDETENLYIEGDNLEVLKLLQETYLGKIKMIYIDPPYNTGNDFIYNDEFSVSSSEFSERSGNFDEEGNLLVDNYTRNTESNGRFHTDWLNMMYPRLKLARDLLSDDGVIFISIDDREQENVKKICNEIFGEDNCVGIGQWRRVEGKPGKSKGMGRTSEFVLIYSKSNTSFQIGTLPLSEAGLKEFRYEDENGKFRRGQIYYPNRGIHNYTVKTPYGNEISGDFTIKQEVFNEYVRTGKIYWAEQGDHTPYLKIYLSEFEGVTPTNTFGKEFGSSQAAVKEFKALFNMDNMIFDNPKPTKLLNQLLLIANTRKDSIILDFFSGSATTAHAVMQLNAEDGGNRKFIMVQLPEPCDEKSEAFKSGYKNICEIGKERIRRAGQQILKTCQKDKEKSHGLDFANAKSDENLLFNETPLGVSNPCDNIGSVAGVSPAEGVAENAQAVGARGDFPPSGNYKLDIGFRVLKCDTSNMEDVYYTPDHIDTNDLFKNNIKSDRTGEDLLFQTMLDLGIMLSSKIETKKINGKEVFCVEGNYLMACFDDSVDEATITEIAKEKPYYFVMRDPANSKDGDSLITNFEQIFTTYSPETVRKIL